MLPNCFSVHSNMAPAAQVRRSERNGGRQRCGEQRDEKGSVSRSPSFLLFPCDRCKAVDHAPALSVFLIKILYLKAHRREGGEKKKVESFSVNISLCERGRERPSHSVTHSGNPVFKYGIMHWQSVDSESLKRPKIQKVGEPATQVPNERKRLFSELLRTRQI